MNSADQMIDHEIVSEPAQPLRLKCKKTGWSTQNISYIMNKTCMYCGPIKFHTPVNGNPNPISTRIICDKCPNSEPMFETSPGIWYCAEGHKKLLLSIEQQEEKEREERRERRSRSIQFHCPVCSKVAYVTKEVKLTAIRKISRTYSCGHTELLDINLPPVDRDEKWNKLYPFQRTGVEFIEASNYRCMVADAMGLGKTAQALMALRYNFSNLTPTLIICEASKVFDWRNEFKMWVADKLDPKDLANRPFIHKKGKYGLLPGVNVHIISMALLSKDEVIESIKDYGFKLVIVDESQSFKSERTDRTAALVAITKAIPNIIFLSGTPIMNNIMEYAVPLNILRPSHWPNKSYLRNWCDFSDSGRCLGLNKYRRPQFFERVGEYIIRRTKKESGIKLPKLRFNKHSVPVDQNKEFVTLYNSLIDEMEEIIAKLKDDAGSIRNIMGVMSKFRRALGIGKVPAIAQLVEEFMEMTEPEDKLCIGIHHHDTRTFLRKALAKYDPIEISDEPAEIKMKRLEEFRKPGRRLMIASIKACGQGLNIQFCKNALIAERQWNPASERQFAERFHRIDTNPDGSLKVEFDDARDSVTIDTLNAADTMDEFFESLNELKVNVVDSTMDEEFIPERGYLLDLCHKITATRLKYVGA